MCSRSVSKGDRRTWFTCHAHFWLAFEISRDDLGVARPFERSSSSFDEDFFFLREPAEEKKTRGVDAYPIR